MEHETLFLPGGMQIHETNQSFRKRAFQSETCETGETSQSTRAQCVVPLT